MYCFKVVENIFFFSTYQIKILSLTAKAPLWLLFLLLTNKEMLSMNQLYTFKYIYIIEGQCYVHVGTDQ